MTTIKKQLITLLALATFFACTKEKTPVVTTTPGDDLTKGVLIINEGGFGKGTAGFDWYLPAKKQLSKDVFKSTNGFPLGDVLQSISRVDDDLYLVVNNSQKIEIINRNTGKSTGTITGLSSPRYAVASGNNIYVSDLFSGKISVVDKTTKKVAKTITTNGWSEQMAVVGNEVFVCRIIKGNCKIMVIDATTQTIKDSSLLVDDEPQWIVKDKDNKLWVLCDFYAKTKAATLLKINPTTRAIEATYSFPDMGHSPSKLSINKAGYELYFLSKGGIYKRSISYSGAVVGPFISKNSFSLYGLGIDPSNGDYYLGDAIDFTQAGYVFHYNNNGVAIDSFKAGVNPSGFYFGE
ncbi:MAG: hypothetical protein NTX03_09970 [Bacteroidetes bacterium]|nr:hypothetical protein [Bacteroidota bacterium]